MYSLSRLSLFFFLTLGAAATADTTSAPVAPAPLNSKCEDTGDRLRARLAVERARDAIGAAEGIIPTPSSQLAELETLLVTCRIAEYELELATSSLGSDTSSTQATYDSALKSLASQEILPSRLPSGPEQPYLDELATAFTDELSLLARTPNLASVYRLRDEIRDHLAKQLQDAIDCGTALRAGKTASVCDSLATNETRFRSELTAEIGTYEPYVIELTKALGEAQSTHAGIYSTLISESTSLQSTMNQAAQWGNVLRLYESYTGAYYGAAMSCAGAARYYWWVWAASVAWRRPNWGALWWAGYFSNAYNAYLSVYYQLEHQVVPWIQRTLNGYLAQASQLQADISALQDQLRTASSNLEKLQGGIISLYSHPQENGNWMDQQIASLISTNQ